MPPQIAGDAAASDMPHPGADFLNRHHGRIAEDERPEQSVAKLSAHLRVLGDAAGVVMGGPGDESWPEGLEGRSFARLGFRGM